MHLLAGAKENDVILQKNTSFILSLFYSFLIRNWLSPSSQTLMPEASNLERKKKEKEKLNR